MLSVRINRSALASILFTIHRRPKEKINPTKFNKIAILTGLNIVVPIKQLAISKIIGSKNIISTENSFVFGLKLLLTRSPTFIFSFEF